MPAHNLADWVHDARQRTFELVADLTDEQLMGPRLAIVNPLLWEIGHVTWFQEKWVLRHACKRQPVRRDADLLYDSAAIPHDTRWDLPLPSRAETLAYMCQVRDRVAELADRRDLSRDERYFILLSIFHEDMHTEAFTYTRQTLGYPAPRLGAASRESAADSRQPRAESRQPKPERSRIRLSAVGSRLPADGGAGPLPGDVAISGGTFMLGATPDEPFVFDNEKWAHAVDVRPFAIARAPVTQAEFAAFVDDAGYRRRELWSLEGWRWRESAAAEQPLHWQRESGGGWLRRHFDQWVPLEPHRPVIHLNWHEAEAYCRWARRRLPSEAEWELAAAGRKRRFPWGDQPPSPEVANLDWRAMGCVDVAACSVGDSAFGCRQMIGNVWEWTASDFLPFPGFVADPYKEYSEPWFGTHKVLRGGCWATRSRLLRNTWRNFYTPDRRDVWAGFRTCALEK